MKDIPGFEGIYAATEDGRIWSYPKKNPLGYGATHEGKFLSPGLVGRGYLQVNLLRSDGKYHTRLVHRLVALTFLPNPENLPQVEHKNDIKTDNRVENLEWSNNTRNMKHMVERGHYNYSRKTFPKSAKMLKKLDKEAVVEILDLAKKGFFHKIIAEQFGVSRRLIRYYVNKYPNGLPEGAYEN